MDFIRDFINTYAQGALYSVLAAIAALIGHKVRQFLNDKTKARVVRDCVRAIEQLYPNLPGISKKQKAEEAIVAMLGEKGLTITTLEMDTLIESVVAGFNYGYKWVEESEEGE